MREEGSGASVSAKRRGKKRDVSHHANGVFGGEIVERPAKAIARVSAVLEDALAIQAAKPEALPKAQLDVVAATEHRRAKHDTTRLQAWAEACERLSHLTLRVCSW